jgi:hypothetical protein
MSHLFIYIFSTYKSLFYLGDLKSEYETFIWGSIEYVAMLEPNFINFRITNPAEWDIYKLSNIPT